MESMHGFELLREQDIDELKTQAQLFQHTKTRAELLSLKNDSPHPVQIFLCLFLSELRHLLHLFS